MKIIFETDIHHQRVSIQQHSLLEAREFFVAVLAFKAAVL